MKLCMTTEAICMTPEAIDMPPNEHAEFEKLIQLDKLVVESKNGGRTIAYGVAGDPNGVPILLFTPLAATRRTLLVLGDHLIKKSLKAICVNRPGVDGTSHSEKKGSTAKDHVDQALEDIIEVLNALEIQTVSILCMCAGTAFALAFCNRHADRVASGKFLGIAPWVLPADCPHSKRVFRFAAHYLPKNATGSLVSSLNSLMMGYISPEFMARKFHEKASENERKCLDERYKNEETRNDDFAREVDWMLLGRDGGSTLDVAVCLSTSQDLGIDYTKGTSGALFLNGDNDGMAPLAVTEWLAQQIPKSSVTVIPKGTHNGALFILDERIIESLNVLR